MAPPCTVAIPASYNSCTIALSFDVVFYVVRFSAGDGAVH